MGYDAHGGLDKKLAHEGGRLMGGEGWRDAVNGAATWAGLEGNVGPTEGTCF